ncbi:MULTISPECIES: bifunctional cobalt-precorrin-7 (C(5))-methyltransferase/cobalt-precorrin-6B (C(15))-methyltransferase [Kamptonema]|uniref:bifunctional cobalt-precorrin-7 (C(5))-methyltransferase/cobalt-precorrin-6B (C(15))-methyltransferase n=1 Tax=Kamptonema TaxID=1501433 RepID=UPI0001DAC6A0|nr:MULTISPECIES: bifunctional cobalt-precorrin-7 (C(5))-methyltransferase/cobalt-precorrin-6B (C(15))-methyltransferase [Kamptonema]CBN55481.1 precorrin-6Y C5,15-methyltransferase (decarboxylating) [Kamptonema sp. PCC 6506]
MTVHIVGIGLDGAAGLSKSVQQIVEKATLLVGSDRHLAYFSKHRAERLVLGDLTGAIKEIRQRLATSFPGAIVVLVSGDPLFYGWGRLLVAELPPEQLIFHPHLSSVQLAFNRLKLPWQDAHFISAHRRSFEELTAKLQQGVDKIAVLTDETYSPGAIAHLIKALDLPSRYQFWLCENLGAADERVRQWSLDALQGETFAPLNLVVLLRESRTATEPLDLGSLPMLGIPDGNFLSFSDRPGVMTQREVRVLILGELSLQPGQAIWDVGAGTGAVSIEIARLFPGSQVYAIEKMEEGTSLIEQNCRRFQVQNVISIHGNAPEILHRLRPPNRIFVGGSGGEITKILGVCALRMLPGGVIVLAMSTVEDLAAVLSWKEERMRREPNWNCKIMQVQLSRSLPVGNLTRFDSLNPVTIVTMNR